MLDCLEGGASAKGVEFEGVLWEAECSDGENKNGSEYEHKKKNTAFLGYKLLSAAYKCVCVCARVWQSQAICPPVNAIHN